MKCMRIAPVFELIKTLTAAEVKMLKQRAESPNAAFLSLLKIMVQAPTNDEAGFKTSFKKNHPDTDYTETKSYLYYYILQHLTERSNKLNDFTAINYNFVTAEMLTKRGLVKEAISVLKNTDEHAAREDYHQLRIVALKRLQRLQFLTIKTDTDYKLLEHLHKQEIEQLKLEEAASHCFILYTRFVKLIERYGGPINEKTEKQFTDIINNPFIQNYRQYKSQQIQTICFDLVTNHYFLVNDTINQSKEYLIELKRLSATNLKNPYNAYRYLFVLFNLIGITKSKALSKKYAELLKKAQAPDENTRRYKELFLLQREFTVVTPANLHSLLETFNIFKQSAWLLNKDKERMSLHLTVVKVLTVLKKYRECEEICSTIINNRELEKVLPAHFIAIRLFYLVALLEQKKYDQMEPVLRSVKYFSQNKQLKNEVTNALLVLLQRLSNTSNLAKQKQALHAVRKAIAGTKHFQYVQFGLNEFIDSGWLSNCEKKLNA